MSIIRTSPASRDPGYLYESVWILENPTNTGTAGIVSWQNPFTTPVLAQVTYVVTTAGTGTINIGTATNATGSGTHIVDSGTLAVGAYAATDLRASDNQGGEYLIQGNGTAGDSIVAQTDEATSLEGAVIIRFRQW